MNDEHARETAHRILEEFEDLLTEKGIIVPSDDRAGDPDEARLFGMEYSRLEEKIVEILMSWEPAAVRSSSNLEVKDVLTRRGYVLKEEATRRGRKTERWENPRSRMTMLIDSFRSREPDD